MKTSQLIPGHVYRLPPRVDGTGFRIFVLAVYDESPQPRRTRLVCVDVLLVSGKIETRCSVNPAQWEFVV
jgi:hypothetical protein